MSPVSSPPASPPLSFRAKPANDSGPTIVAPTPPLAFPVSSPIPPHLLQLHPNADNFYYGFNPYWYLHPFQLYNAVAVNPPATPPAMPSMPSQMHHHHHHHHLSSNPQQYWPYPMAPSPPTIDLPRGPPKKPAQSGYALWVGNLAKDTQLMDLCRLFATDNLQSVLLIEKTNCAFVNYTSEEALKHGLKVLEERGRCLRGQNLTIKEQIQPDSTTQPPRTRSSSTTTTQPPCTRSSSTCSEITAVNDNNQPSSCDSDSRYFICKSLTTEDLDASVKLGIWATQSHNEETLTRAFHTCKNVYLIFSVNKSGQFYGYARMESEPIVSPESSPSSLSQQLMASSYENMQGPRITSIPADPSINLPRGRIVDDTPRCSIFWEAVDSESTSTNWTVPFRIKWMSPLGRSVPFSKTNHLFNAFNDNQQVKIARDGIEVDPDTGKMLIDMFHQL